MTRYLRSGDNYLVGPAGGLLAIPAPTLALALVSGDLYEGNAATFRVSLSKPWSVDVTFNYATSNGTGSAGTDYTSTSGTATITAGDLFADVAVPTTLRAGSQASRTFTLTLSAAEDGGGDPLTFTTPAVTATILDTETAPELPTLSVAAVAAADEGDPLTFRVTASFAPTEDITFSYATSNGSASAGTDYTAASGTGTITAGTLTDDIAVTTTLRSGFQGARTVVMTISDAETASSAAVTISTAAATGTIAETETPTGDHAYFETLVADGAFWKGYSLRPLAGQSISSVHYASQLLKPNQGGYANSNSAALAVTYDPGADTDPDAQDAAKAVIPAWSAVTTLASAVAPSDTFIHLTAFSSSLYGNGRGVLIGDELMTVNRPSGTVITGNMLPVNRAQRGTTAASHSVGATVSLSQNSLGNQVRLPLNTTDGYTYLFTWDAYWPDINRMPRSGFATHKAFQFDSNALWLEPQIRFDGGSASPGTGFDSSIHMAVPEMRSYNTLGGNADWSLTDGTRLGPSVTSVEPIQPKAGSFVIHPNRWTRFWVRIKHTADDYDLMDYWVADEEQAAVQIYADIPLSVEPLNNSIGKFWIELNTSVTTFVREFPAGFPSQSPDLVIYLRNFAALRWTLGAEPSMASYLEQP